jgi:hypothetical protein
MKDEEPVRHKDVLGNEITEVSKLAVARHNQLVVCSIIKIHPKMMRVARLGAKNPEHNNFLAYPDNAIVVDGPDAMIYMLKGGA